MTTDQLLTLYKRAIQYCVAYYGKGEPDEIRLEEDGNLSAKWTYRQYEEDDYEYFSIDKLTSNLDEIYKERKDKEEQDRIKAQKHQQEQKVIREQLEKERRRSEYEKLKKEFN